MDDNKAALKRFLFGSHNNHDISYNHYYHRGEYAEFGITSHANDEYFFIESVNGEKSVRGYYRFADMEEDETIVVDFLEIADNYCVLMIRSFDNAKFKVVVSPDETRKVSICLL